MFVAGTRDESVKRQSTRDCTTNLRLKTQGLQDGGLSLEHSDSRRMVARETGTV
jgi:hypothetical protein